MGAYKESPLARNAALNRQLGRNYSSATPPPPPIPPTVPDREYVVGENTVFNRIFLNYSYKCLNFDVIST